MSINFQFSRNTVSKKRYKIPAKTNRDIAAPRSVGTKLDRVRLKKQHNQSSLRPRGASKVHIRISSPGGSDYFQQGRPSAALTACVFTGQYASLGPVAAYKRFCPLLRGLGVYPGTRGLGRISGVRRPARSGHAARGGTGRRRVVVVHRLRGSHRPRSAAGHR